MKRSYFGFALVIALLVLGLLGSTVLSSLHTPLARTASRAAREAEAGNLPAARALIRRVSDGWHTHSTLRQTLMDRRSLDQVDTLLAELEAYGNLEENALFAAACRRLAQALENAARDQELSWENLLRRPLDKEENREYNRLNFIGQFVTILSVNKTRDFDGQILPIF